MIKVTMAAIPSKNLVWDDSMVDAATDPMVTVIRKSKALKDARDRFPDTLTMIIIDIYIKTDNIIVLVMVAHP